MKKERLTKQFRSAAMTELEDIIAIFAINVENAFLTHGAEPNKDYTYKDLIELATPYALEHWKKYGQTFSLS